MVIIYMALMNCFINLSIRLLFSFSFTPLLHYSVLEVKHARVKCIISDHVDTQTHTDVCPPRNEHSSIAASPGAQLWATPDSASHSDTQVAIYHPARSGASGAGAAPQPGCSQEEGAAAGQGCLEVLLMG